ncbi:glycosyltransferase family 4 protein [Micromonospora zamorensis]|uniref:glycosyltransferase family 4 protein n=1 Tax=Micromonospora zamorensis TaxID=709883 RepID=UPI0036A33B07
MEPGGAPRPTRGRVVMLVDNGVHGDSRVQKTARSAAEAGWDVVLLGILGHGAQESWTIGDARVRLIRVPRSLGQHPSQFHRSMRRPLAYPPGRQGGYRIQRMKAWQAAVEERRVARAAARRSGAGSVAGQLRGLLDVPAMSAAKVLGRWAKFRAGELHRLRLRQQDPDDLVTRTSIRFWQLILGPRAWRRLDRGLWDYELAFGPVIDQLAPDIIHANDFRMIGVGVRAARRGRARGLGTRLVWDAHEFVGGVLGRADNPRWLPAQVAHVQEYVGAADAVVTVSATLAELLQRTHRLPVCPDVVLNAPPRPVTQAHDTGVDVRARCGLDAATPLLVYCGGVNQSRGVELMIDALPQLDGVHVALVTLHPTANNAASEALRARAVEVGVADRVHLLPYVPHWQVPAFLSGADAGVIPIHHKPNHELALITKFLEYSHARLPIVVSDVRTMADTVRETGQGEIFRAEDVADYVRAVRAVLADPARYRVAYDRSGLIDGWTWEAQAEVLETVYRRVRPDLAPLAAERAGATSGAG